MTKRWLYELWEKCFEKTNALGKGKVLRKQKDYRRAVFSADVVKEAYAVFRELVPDEHKERLDNEAYLTVETSDGDWHGQVPKFL